MDHPPTDVQVSRPGLSSLIALERGYDWTSASLMGARFYEVGSIKAKAKFKDVCAPTGGDSGAINE